MVRALSVPTGSTGNRRHLRRISPHDRGEKHDVIATQVRVIGDQFNLQNETEAVLLQYRVSQRITMFACRH